MGLFTEEQKIELVPRTQGSLAGENYLQNLIGQTPTIPQQGVANLSPIQMLIQQQLGNYLASSNQAGDAASKYYASILGSDYDVFNDPRYQALKLQTDQNARAAETAAKRLGEGQGVLHSSGTQQKVYTDVASTQSPLLSVIGDLLTNREGQKMQAAQGVQTAESQKLANISAVNQIADIGRSLEQQRLDSVFNQLITQILFPFQYQAQLANSLMNFKPDYAVTGGGLSDFGMLAQMGAQVGGMALGGWMGGLGGAAAGGAGVGGATNVNNMTPFQEQLFRATATS